MSPCLQPLKMSVTKEMNHELLNTSFVEEVYWALHDMAPLKALGPDGFTAGFFRRIGVLSGRTFVTPFWVLSIQV
jgi:hypothetical protein